MIQNSFRKVLAAGRRSFVFGPFLKSLRVITIIGVELVRLGSVTADWVVSRHCKREFESCTFTIL